MPGRHPASGYVQGINDLVTPFLAVFLSAHLSGPLEDWQVDGLSEEEMLCVEADSYFCLSKLLDGIQDHYTYAQPGIQRTVFSMKELVRCGARPPAPQLPAGSFGDALNCVPRDLASSSISAMAGKQPEGSGTASP